MISPALRSQTVTQSELFYHTQLFPNGIKQTHTGPEAPVLRRRTEPRPAAWLRPSLLQGWVDLLLGVVVVKLPQVGDQRPEQKQTNTLCCSEAHLHHSSISSHVVLELQTLFHRTELKAELRMSSRSHNTTSRGQQTPVAFFTLSILSRQLEVTIT